MRGTDRLLDVLHGVYERLIRWIFSAAATQVRAAAPGLRPAVRRRRRARQGGAAPLALRDDHAARGRRPRRHRQLRPALAIAPLVGTEFIPESDNSYIQHERHAAGGHQPAARQRQAAPGRGDRAQRCPRSAWSRRPSATPATAAAIRRSCSIQLVKPHERKLQPAATSKGDPRGARADPRHRGDPRQPADLRRPARPRPGRARGRGAEAAGEGREGARHRRPDHVGQARHSGLRGAPEARRRARARPDDDAARLEPARLRQRRRRDLLDLARRRAGRRRAAPAADLAREHRPARRPAGRLRQGRHADRAVERGRVVPVVNPVVIKRQDLQRRQAIYAGTEGPAERRRRRRRAEDRQGVAAAAGLSLRRRRPDAGPAGGVHRRAARARRGGDLHLHRAGVAVLELPAAARDHGVAAAGADRRDAGAARHPLDAQPVLDDRPGDADGPGHQERDPAGRLRQPRPARRPVGARGAAPGRPGADAADHHDDGGDDLRHAAAGARPRRRRRDPGADGARHHRRRDHLDAADAGRRAGDLQLPGAPQAAGGRAGRSEVPGRRGRRRRDAGAACRRRRD